jgi:hypothetical protein
MAQMGVCKDGGNGARDWILWVPPRHMGHTDLYSIVNSKEYFPNKFEI